MPAATTADLLALVDPELRAAAEQMRLGMTRFSPMSMAMLAARREWITSLSPPPYDAPSVVERRIAAGNGLPEITVYVVNARPGDRRPGILHFHGGGLNAGSAMGAMRFVQETAAALDCPIVTVDYHLAPETRWDRAVEEDYAALLWMVRHAEEIGVDPARIAVMGESAGGGHAALLALTARDRGEVALRFQALLYPMIDDRTGSSRAVPAHVGAFGWNVEANRFGWECFLGQQAGLDRAPAGAVPARAGNLAGLPATFIGVGALDLFVDEDIAYARRLIAAGVPTELVVVPGGFHGFDTIVRDAAISRQFTATKHAALRRALAAGA